jgi:hypothetical protein
MKLNKFDETIGIFPNALSKEFCKEVIKLFEHPDIQKHTAVGSTLGGLNNEAKNTLDINLMAHPRFTDFTDELAKVSNKNIEEYVWRWEDDKNNPKFNSNWLFGEGTYYPIWNLQKYKKGVGHYKGWHCESTAAEEVGTGSHHRVITTMFYLNDVEEGGETNFLYSGLKVKPKAGTFLCWPPPWPWVHSGSIPISNDKYIITTWLQGDWAKTL